MDKTTFYADYFSVSIQNCQSFLPGYYLEQKQLVADNPFQAANDDFGGHYNEVDYLAKFGTPFLVEQTIQHFLAPTALPAIIWIE